MKDEKILSEYNKLKDITNEDLDNMTVEEEKKFFEDHDVHFTEEMIGNQKVRTRHEDWSK